MALRTHPPADSGGPKTVMPVQAPRLIPIAAPMLFELVLGIGVGTFGTWLAARLSDADGAAYAMAHHVLAMLFVVFRIVGAGISVVVAQSLGGARRDAADAVALASLGASTWVGILTGLAALLGAPLLLQLLNTPPELVGLAAPFLMALAPSLLLDAWNATMASVMRAHLKVRETLMVIVSMHLALLLGAWLLMPQMGLVGYAVALAVSRLLGLVLHTALWRSRLNLKPRWFDWWRVPRGTLGPVLHIGLPGAAENIAWRLAFLVSVAAVGQLGASALATQAYALQVSNVVLLFGLATGLSVEIVVGHLVGAGRLHQAHRLVGRALALGLMVSLVVAFAAALAGPWIMRNFTKDPAIIATGAMLLWWTVLLEPGRTFNLVVINALRATGDAKYPVMVGAGSMLLVLAGGSWLLGVVLGWGLMGVWLAYAADEWLRGLLMWRRWARHGWVRHAKASHRRLRMQQLRETDDRGTG
jgi:putative MATE family efflux protein